MFLSVVEKTSNTASIKSSIFCNDVKNSEKLYAVPQVYLLQAVIESFVDGILILAIDGELLHTNECAREMCRQLGKDCELEDKIPTEIWRVCESLIESRELFPSEKIFMEVEVEKSKAVKLRIRARWLHSDGSQEDYIIVTLENCHESSQYIAIADAKKYGLTEREAEVWLLRRANLTYKEIAEQLYITINTVKKHLKNIYAKQQEMSLC
jgi:DNA-binding CsgD family transcriptional regulator